MMPRCECPAEQCVQSDYSPGVVDDSETIVYALVEPLTSRSGVMIISKSKLKESTQSVCRADHCSGAEARANIVGELQRKDPARVDHGFVYARASDIRAIRLGNSNEGAFCIIDDGLEHFRAHALLGYSNPSDIRLRSEREKARGNLLLLFKKNGAIKDWNSGPFGGS